MIPLRLSPVFHKMRDLFAVCLDSGWFMLVADDALLSLPNMRVLREFLYANESETGDASEAQERLAELETVIEKIRDNVLPVLKEKLGISYLAPDCMVKNHDERLLRRFVAYTLPHNLNEMGKLLRELRGDLDPCESFS